MSRAQGIPALAVGAVGAGCLLMYCGIYNVPVVDALRAIIRGQVPARSGTPAIPPQTPETLPATTGRDPNAPGLK